MDRNARKAHKIRGFRAISAPYLWLRDCGCLAEDRTPTFPFEYRPLKSQRNSASFAPIPGLETFAVDRTFRDHRHTSGWTYVPSKEQKLPRRWRRQLWARSEPRDIEKAERSAAVDRRRCPREAQYGSGLQCPGSAPVRHRCQPKIVHTRKSAQHLGRNVPPAMLVHSLPQDVVRADRQRQRRSDKLFWTQI